MIRVRESLWFESYAPDDLCIVVTLFSTYFAFFIFYRLMNELCCLLYGGLYTDLESVIFIAGLASEPRLFLLHDL